MISTTRVARDRDGGHKSALELVRVTSAALEHAVRVIAYACYLAGARNLIAKIRSDVCGPKIRTAIARHDTPTLFDWLIEALSYQGISDRVAYDYLEQHGGITWRDIEQSLSRSVSCPKLRSYWHYYDCRYQKSQGTCGEPNHISRCPVPAYNLRNGRLNQTAFALYLFIRDIADCDLVAWIDAQLVSSRTSSARTSSPACGTPLSDRCATSTAFLTKSSRWHYPPFCSPPRRTGRTGMKWRQLDRR